MCRPPTSALLEYSRDVNYYEASATYNSVLEAWTLHIAKIPLVQAVATGRLGHDYGKSGQSYAFVI